MATSIARSNVAGLARTGAQRTAVRPAVSKALSAPRVPVQRAAAPAPSSRNVSAKAVEIATIASEAAFISGTAFTMVALTLTGLAIGFVLLRVESLVEEGKL